MLERNNETFNQVALKFFSMFERKNDRTVNGGVDGIPNMCAESRRAFPFGGAAAGARALFSFTTSREISVPAKI